MQNSLNITLKNIKKMKKTPKLIKKVCWKVRKNASKKKSAGLITYMHWKCDVAAAENGSVS